MSRLSRLPYFLSYFLGYRKPDHKQKILPLWKICFWSFLAAWVGIAVLEILFVYAPSFQAHHTPMIVASFGASAVLIYGAIDAPLAQPRNVIGGQIIGSIVGVVITQLFLGIKHDWPSEEQRIAVQWVAGATAMATSLVIMQLTKTVHPPAGATALIAVTTTNVIDIKWFYIGVVTLSAVIQVTIGCLINNIERKYPSYWWKPNRLPLQVDPSTLGTVMPSVTTLTDREKEEEVVASNLTAAEEGILEQRKPQKESEDEESISVVQGMIATRLNVKHAASMLKSHSRQALSLEEQKALSSLLDKITNHSS